LAKLHPSPAEVAASTTLSSRPHGCRRHVFTAGCRSGEECAICLQDLRAEETLRAMPRSHAFHQRCISEWLRRNAICPLCRHQLLLSTTPTTPEEEDGGGGST
ncbi:hypothetical protein BAE44_0004663, partial [Dichanthelium oligosanthes]